MELLFTLKDSETSLMTLMVFVRDKNNMIINLLKLTTEYKIMIYIIWNEYKLHLTSMFINRHDIWDTTVAYKGFLGVYGYWARVSAFSLLLMSTTVFKGVEADTDMTTWSMLSTFTGRCRKTLTLEDGIRGDNSRQWC